MKFSVSKVSRFIILLIILLPVTSYGDTTTTTISVSATVQKVCSVSATSLNFNNYNASSVSPTDSTATLTVTCNNGTTYDVGLDAGGGSGATTTTRKLTLSSNTINYQLFRDAGRSQNWGNTIGTDTLNTTGSGTPVNHIVYGRIATGQFVPEGTYVDTVTVTVTY